MMGQKKVEIFSRKFRKSPAKSCLIAMLCCENYIEEYVETASGMGVTFHRGRKLNYIEMEIIPRFRWRGGMVWQSLYPGVIRMVVWVCFGLINMGYFARMEMFVIYCNSRIIKRCKSVKRERVEKKDVKVL